MIAPHRRHVLGGLCACSLFGFGGCVTTGNEPPLAAGYRPRLDSDEGGLWYSVEREEKRIRDSRYRIRDPEWNRYLKDITERLCPEYKADMRVYLVRTAAFNASMYPNGMMHVLTGLLIRVKSEAQLAAVLGHEIGHYLRRHSLARQRDVIARADFRIFLNMTLAAAGAGGVADLANLLLIAGQYAYSREHEREADDVGIHLMAKAGYQPMAASEVWRQIIEERDADPNDRAPGLLFATHPADEERMATLSETAKSLGSAGEVYADRYREKLRGIRFMLLEDELRLRQYSRSLVLLKRLQSESPDDGELLYFQGEVFRLRDGDGDRKRALDTYEKAIAANNPPAEAWRSLGQVQRKSEMLEAAQKSFRRYLDLRPDAEDRAIIKSYLEKTV